MTPLEINVTNDGSILGFTIPPFIEVGSQQGVSVSSTTVLDPGSATTPVRINKTTWSSGLEIVPG